MQVLVLNSAEVVEALHLDQFLTGAGSEIGGDADDGGRNPSIRDIPNQLLLSCNGVISDISQHNDSMLVVIQGMFFLETVDVFQGFHETLGNRCPS